MVSLSAIRLQLKAYKPQSGAQANIKAALEVYTDMEPQLSRDANIQGIRDDFPPQVLYNPEVTKGPHSLFRHIRDYLVLQGIQYEPAEGTNRIIYGLPKMLYLSDDERDMATNLLSFMGAVPQAHASTGSSSESNRIQPFHSNGSDAHHHDRMDNTRLAHNVATRFKKEDTFSGDINQDIKEYLSNYEDVALDYNLNESQKLSYLHNLFKGEAKVYYKSIKLSCRTFEDARTKLIAKYSDIIRQNRIRKTLQSFRLNSIIKEKNLEVPEALSLLRERITRLAPQGPMAHRTEEAKVEYLYHAVVGCKWAKAALANVYSSATPCTLEKLHNSLDSAWLQEQEQIEGNQRDMDQENKSDNDAAAMMYVGQGIYGQPRKYGSKSSAPFQRNFQQNGNNSRNGPFNNNSTGKNGVDFFGNVRRCHNCHSKDHLIRHCKTKPNLIKNINNLVQTNPNGVNNILFELCQQVEDALFTGPENGTDETNNALHETGSPHMAEQTATGTSANNSQYYSDIIHSENGFNEVEPEDF